MVECIEREYRHAAHHLPYESAEGGYIGNHFDTYELLFDILGIDLPRKGSDELRRDLLDGVEMEQWCLRDPGGLRPHEVLVSSWASFCKLVKFSKRFFFLTDGKTNDPYEEELDPGEMLETIGDACIELDLFRKLTPEDKIYRARQQSRHGEHTSASALGPPAQELVLHGGRMNPAGIPAFYAAADEKTTLAEISHRPGKYAIGEWRTSYPITILDLTKARPIPSIFDEDGAKHRDILMFLEHFVEAISDSTLGYDTSEIDYVPTQIVTEYFRHVFRMGKDKVKGIAFASARNPGGVCYALFARKKHVGEGLDDDNKKQWLRLLDVQHVVVSNLLVVPKYELVDLDDD